jgi:hypothetical protein
LKDSFHEEWETFPIYFVHLALLFLLIGIEYAYTKYLKLKDKEKRLLISYQESQNAKAATMNINPLHPMKM